MESIEPAAERTTRHVCRSASSFMSGQLAANFRSRFFEFEEKNDLLSTTKNN